MRANIHRTVVAAMIAAGIGLATAGCDQAREENGGGGGAPAGEQRAVDHRSGEVDVDPAPRADDGRPVAGARPADEVRQAADRARGEIREERAEERAEDRAEAQADARDAANRMAANRVGPATVGARIVGPAKVGPKIVGPKIVGRKIVGPKRTYTRHVRAYHGGGGGKVTAAPKALLQHRHYPPGWTNTPRQREGRHVR